MIRLLQSRSLAFYRMSSSESAPSASGEKYLLFPTTYPIVPYYFYSPPINKNLYNYLQKHKIKYVAAFPVRPGVHPRQIFPQTPQDMQTELGLQGVTWPAKNRSSENMFITNNNVIYGRTFSDANDPPLRVVNGLDQLYPMGSICTIKLEANEHGHELYLRADLRLEAEWATPKEGPISLIGGKVVPSIGVKQIPKQYDELLSLYTRIRNISTVNLPEIDVNNDKPAMNKVIELLTGYLCTLSFFSQDKLYNLFRIYKLEQKIPMLLECYRQYVEVLEQNWKDLSAQGGPENRQKQAINTIYESMKRLVGNAGEEAFVAKIRNKLKKNNYPENIAKLIEAELLAIETQGSHDISRKKHYVTLLADYPFGVRTEEKFDLEGARALLEEHHYGMQKLKRRILEFIAVSKLKGQFRSKVLLLHGPPGVGKTSIVKSIAECLNRPYARVSLGGQYDTAIVKGHRKTYIGAYPGKIWDSIYRAKAENPVILLDEIDKIVTRAGGSSLQDAVMEVLDPVQNHRFKDDFMDVEIDLSRVLFICTANSLDTIFPPLLDRLERIQVVGYTTPEKEQIFQRYIVKQAKEENGLTGELGEKLSFSPEAVRQLIQGYCKEAGVRSLVRKTNQIFQKMAYKYVKNIPFNNTVLPNQLRQYLGLPLFHHARLFPSNPPAGVMIGLAYNNYGGSIMYIQCVHQGSHKGKQEKGEQKEKQGSLLVTGNIHDVMKESVQLAHSYAKFLCSSFFNNHYLEHNDVHLNFPEIQIGKDGPSAGAAITSALVSLALDKPMVQEIAMTGEITLSGKVNPIGGVKEKTMGAKRQGITTLIFPEDNRRDVDELEAEIKEGMTFHFASNYLEVLDLVLGLKVQEQTLAS